MTKQKLVLGAAAILGGWGGAAAMARIGATYGLRLGPWGTVLGGAIGAALGVGLSRKLIDAYGETAGLHAEDHEELEPQPDREAA